MHSPFEFVQGILAKQLRYFRHLPAFRHALSGSYYLENQKFLRRAEGWPTRVRGTHRPSLQQSCGWVAFSQEAVISKSTGLPSKKLSPALEMDLNRLKHEVVGWLCRAEDGMRFCRRLEAPAGLRRVGREAKRKGTEKLLASP